MSHWILKSKVALGILCVTLSVAAVSLTDLQSDEQNQRTVKVYGNYSGEALTLPDQLVCVLSQLWKTEFVDQGNVHVKVNEKKCFGTGDGDEEITAIVNLTVDPVTGDTIGKIWYDDQNSTAFNGNDGIVYIKGVVSAAPSSLEPYGRFDISVVEQLNNDGQYAVDGERLSSMRILATGNTFKFVAQSREVAPITANLGSFNTFSSYADRQAKRAAYKDNNGTTTVISYDNSNICFKTASNATSCYEINDNAATLTVGSYGLYNSVGTRIFTAVTAANELEIDGNFYYMRSGFGGSISADTDPDTDDPSMGPGLVTSTTPANLNGSPVKVAWLARYLTNTTTVPSNLPMDADTRLLLDPTASGVLTDIRSEIGPLPRAALSSTIRARAGKIL